ncbi:universal stress protein [Maribacter thermophilus]|uniref:universal stress protein n=1 Tax=Maribacter thermophilus TaxID=1197874 RepID=UPI0006410652|nr:universal stress protein [Maribacter thermophilus]
MGKNILLPTDFSRSSWSAIQYATKLFEDCDCDFYILNTYAKETHGLDNLTLLDPDEAFNKMSEKKSKEGLGNTLARLTLSNNNIDHRFHVLSKSNLFIDTVKDVVHDLAIDMIVMGAKGAGNRRGNNYGKNTLAVIENIRKCPILVVPKNVSFNSLKEIVLATDFNTNFNRYEVKCLAEIAKLTNASVQILSLTDAKELSFEQRKNKILLRKFLHGIDHAFNVLHNVEMPTAISCFIESRKSNMVSYIDKKPSFFKKLGFGKPTLGKLGFYKHVPVLALHA